MMRAGGEDPHRYYWNKEMEQRYGFARAVSFQGLLYVSGTVSSGDGGSIEGKGSMSAQAERVYENLTRILSDNGLKPSNVLKETIFTTDIDEFLANTQSRLNFYSAGAPPATTAVEVRRLAHPDVLLEIEVIASGV